MRAKLEKILVYAGNYSRVLAGDSQTGEVSVFDYTNKEEPKPITDLNEIVEGKQVLIIRGMQWINTSPIKEIVKRTLTSVEFQTQTSLYQLTILEDYQE